MPVIYLSYFNLFEQFGGGIEGGLLVERYVDMYGHIPEGREGRGKGLSSFFLQYLDMAVV